MQAATILDRLTELGVKATVEGGRLRFEPGSRIPPDLVEAIRANKREIVEAISIRSPATLRWALTQKTEEIGVMHRRLASPYYADDGPYQEWCKDQIECLQSHVAEIQRHLREGGTLRLPPCCNEENHICLIAMRRFDGCLFRPDECGSAMSLGAGK